MPDFMLTFSDIPKRLTIAVAMAVADWKSLLAPGEIKQTHTGNYKHGHHMTCSVELQTSSADFHLP